MKLLVDVDAVAKLAHWNLLDALPLLTKVPFAQCATLSSAKYRAQRAIENPDGKLFHSKDAAIAAIAAIRGMTASIESIETLLPVLQDLPGIDAGEAVLLSATANSESIRLLTGDKRALRALSQLPLESRVGFSGKIIVIEQVLLAALSQFGIDELRKRVCPHKDLDKAVGIAMGSKCDAPESSVRDGLNSYVNEIAQACAPSLLAKFS